MRPLPLLLALVLLAPVAHAATLADFEEPREGLDQLYPFTVTNDDAEKPYAVVFRGSPGRGFGLQVLDAQGEEQWVKNGSRGLQSFPTLEPGEYRLFLRGQGAFQITDKLLDRKDHPVIPYVLNVSSTLEGGTDAYVIAPSENWTMDVTGDVTVEFWDMTSVPETVESPFNRTTRYGVPYVITVRGEPGTPYALGFTATTLPEEQDTPGPGPALVFLAAALALGVARIRRTR